MTNPVHLEVFAPDAVTSIAVVTRRDRVRWQDEINGVGPGQFRIHLDDQLLTDQPTLLDPFNIVKVRPATATDPVFAWLLEGFAPVKAGDQEAASRWATIVGRDILCLLEQAFVNADGDLRIFDFSSPDLPGYPADWDAPVGVLAADDTTARANQPADFPDDLAEWIWSTDPTATAPAERNWFRGEFTLASETDVTIWATADNSMRLLLNGNEVITTDPTNLFNWRTTSPYHATLPAGTHLVAAAVDNAEAAALNPGAFRCVVGTTDDQGALDTVLLRTNETDWLVHPAADPPGWHAAQILIALLLEAQADGYLVGVTWDFDGDQDSGGTPWDDLKEERIPVDSNLLSVSFRWAGIVFDLEMGHDLVLHAWKRRGSDVSADVELLLNENVLGLAPQVNYEQIRNVARIRYDGGKVEVTDAASAGAYGKRPISLSLGGVTTEAQAIQIGEEALVDLAQPQINLPVQSTSAKGPQPYTDYGKGDTVSAPGLTGQTDARVIAITAVEQENHISWVTELYPETP